MAVCHTTILKTIFLHSQEFLIDYNYKSYCLKQAQEVMYRLAPTLEHPYKMQTSLEQDDYDDFDDYVELIIDNLKFADDNELPIVYIQEILFKYFC